MKLLMCLLLVGIFSCSSSKKIKQDIAENIETVFYQKWIAGVENGGSGINFHVVFKKPLTSDYKLEKIQFDTYEQPIEKLSETEYIARIKTLRNDITLDENPEKEYGNQAAETKLKSNEANLFFTIKGEEIIKNIQNVKEKPMLAYPSVKPKN